MKPLAALVLLCLPCIAQQPPESKGKTSSFERLKAKAESGEAKAMFMLGFCYANGEGVPQDHKEAVAWYRKAAELGEVIAMYGLASCYESGQGVPQDHKEAAAWYRKAADLGDAGAMFSLGLC